MKLHWNLKYTLKKYQEYLQKNKGDKNVLALIALILDVNQSEKSIQEAIYQLEQIKGEKKSGETEASYVLGSCLFYGLLHTDYEGAFLCYQFSASSHDPFALNKIGLCYERGIGIKPDLKAAIYLYTIGAEKGDPSSIYHLGYIFESQQEYAVAVEYYKKAAEKGHPIAQFKLADFFYKGIVVEKDEKRAFELYALSASQDYYPAQNALGAHYLCGHRIHSDFKRAMEFITYSAMEDYDIAQHNLAEIYVVGKSVPKNLPRAALLYQRASQKKYEQSTRKLKLILHAHQHDFPTLDEALSFYQDRYNKEKDIMALIMVAFCYQMGLSVEQDIFQAITLYEEATTLGTNCSWDIYFCYRRLHAMGFDVEKGLRFFYSTLPLPIKPAECSEKQKKELEHTLLMILLNEEGGPFFEKSSSKVLDYYQTLNEWRPSKEVEDKIGYYLPLHSIKQAVKKSTPLNESLISIIAGYAFEPGSKKSFLAMLEGMSSRISKWF